MWPPGSKPDFPDHALAERQPLAAIPGGQGETGSPAQGPDRIEARVAGRAEPSGGLAHGTRRQQHIDFGKDIIEIAAKRLRRLDRLDIGRERQRATACKKPVAQGLAQLLAVNLVFVGVVACRLEFEDPAVMVENVGRGQRNVPHRGARGRQYCGRVLEQGMSVAIGVLPGRCAAKADPRRGGLAVDASRLLRQKHPAQ